MVLWHQKGKLILLQKSDVQYSVLDKIEGSQSHVSLQQHLSPSVILQCYNVALIIVIRFHVASIMSCSYQWVVFTHLMSLSQTTACMSCGLLISFAESLTKVELLKCINEVSTVSFHAPTTAAGAVFSLVEANWADNTSGTHFYFWFRHKSHQ